MNLDLLDPQWSARIRSKTVPYLCLFRATFGPSHSYVR